MRNIGIGKLFLLFFVTFGIYQIVWLVKTKIQMNTLGADIPTAWLLIIPIANLYFLWKYSEGVEKVTNNDLSKIAAFLLTIFLGFIAFLIIQSSFNKVAAPEA